MATLAELELKFKSDIAAKSDKDAAALQRVDAQIKKAEASLGSLEKAARAAGQARIAADEKVAAAQAKLNDVTQGDGGKVSVAAVRAAQRGLELAVAKAQAEENAKIAASRSGLEALASAGNRAAKIAAREKSLLAEQRRNLDAASADAKAHFDEQREKAEAAAQESKKAGVEMTNAMTAAAKVAAVAAAAIAAATLAVIAFGFKAATAARNLLILGTALTGNEALGTEFVAIVNQLAREVPLAKDQITELAREMSLLKLGRRDLQAGLTAVAIVTSAIGDAAGGAIKSIIAANAATKLFFLGARDRFGEFTALAGTGLKSADIIAALAKQMKKSLPEVEAALRAGRISLADGVKALEAAARSRFGKTIAAQMLDVNVQIDKAKEALSGLFDGVDLEPVLGALKVFLSVLDTSTVTGRVLKALLNVTFGGLGASLGVVGPIAKVVFQGMIIAALKLYIALKPIFAVIGAVASAIGLVLAKIQEWTGINVALRAGQFIFAAIAATVGLLATAIIIATIPLAILAAAVLAIGYLVYLVVDQMIDTWNALAEFFGSIDWSGLGSALIDGLIEGVTSKASAFIGSITGLADKAAAAFAAVNLIKSPSQRYARMGSFIPEGAAQGVDEKAPELERSVVDMSDSAAAAPQKSGPGASRGAAGGTGPTVNIYINGRKLSGGEARDELRDFLIEELSIVDGAIGAGA